MRTCLIVMGNKEIGFKKMPLIQTYWSCILAGETKSTKRRRKKKIAMLDSVRGENRERGGVPQKTIY